MIRNLKVLGVALAAVFALGAVAASMALGEEEVEGKQAYLTAENPATLKGTETGSQTNRLTSFGSFTECPGSTYLGTTEENKTFSHGTTVKIEPTYIKCVSSALKFATTVNMNGCYYIFHLKTTTVGSTDTYGVTATVVGCTAGKHIEVTTVIGGKHCTTTITENAAGYTGLDVIDTTASHDIDITGTIKGIKADQKGPGCPKGEEEQTTETGELHLDVTVVGETHLGEPINIGISELGDSTSTP